MLVAPLFDERKEIVVGAKAVGAYDIPDDGEPGATGSLIFTLSLSGLGPLIPLVMNTLPVPLGACSDSSITPPTLRLPFFPFSSACSDGPITEFWLTAFGNHDKISPYITERDNEVLAYLEDVRSEVLTGEERGFKLTFHFRENPFFSNQASAVV